MKIFKHTSYLFILIAITMLIAACSSTEEKENVDIKDIVNSINGEPVVPRRANTIYIQKFINRTPATRITEKLSQRIREHISKDRRLAVNDSIESSDLILTGTITALSIQNTKFNNMGIAEKKRLRITASIKLPEKAGMRLIFYEKEMQAFKEFSDTVPPIQSEDMAMEDVINELARRITAKTLTGWYTELMTPIEKGKK